MIEVLSYDVNIIRHLVLCVTVQRQMYKVQWEEMLK